jgi:hypothetical protein
MIVLYVTPEVAEVYYKAPSPPQSRQDAENRPESQGVRAKRPIPILGIAGETAMGLNAREYRAKAPAGRTRRLYRTVYLK